MTKYLITGATGNLGSAAVKHTLAKGVAANKISILVRDPKKAESLTSQGVTAIKGDYFDYKSLVDAFKTVDKVLVIGAVSLSNRVPQHQNIAKAIKDSGIKHVVYISLVHPDKPRVKITEVTDVEIETEKSLMKSGIPYTIIRNPLYSEAIIPIIGMKFVETGVRGAGGGKTATASIDELAEGAVSVLLGNGHENKIYDFGSGDNNSFDDIANILSQIIGQKVPYVVSTKEDYVKQKVEDGFPKPQSAYFWEFVEAIGEGDFEVTSTDLEKVLGRKPESLKHALERTMAAAPQPADK